MEWEPEMVVEFSCRGWWDERKALGGWVERDFEPVEQFSCRDWPMEVTPYG